MLRDRETGRFRIWYVTPVSETQSHATYMESTDGIHWERPHRVLADPGYIRYWSNLIDEGPGFPDPQARYKYAYHNDGGLNIAVSPDGLVWKPLVPRTVLRHSHDINCILRDPLCKRYIAMVNAFIVGDRGSGDRWRWKGGRRVTMQSVSHDLLNWRKPWLVISPEEELDKGQTQFYGQNGFIVRGDLMIGLVKVLRDDLPADTGGPARGIGYTCLTWTRDGEHWTRDREVFFDRNHAAGAWDHAMSWIDCQLPVGEEVYLYYGGYARGHKVNRFQERQIGMLRMRRDRYVAREAGKTPGLLRTPPIVVEGTDMTLNVDADDGQVRVRILSVDGSPVKGFDFADCRAISTDSLEAPVQWQRRLPELNSQPVRLEFSLKNAQLFGFSLR